MRLARVPLGPRPLLHPLRSRCPALFAGFFARMAESDFSGPFIIGYGSSPSRCGPARYCGWSDPRSPGSRAKSERACQVLRPRRVVRVLALTHSDMWPSTRQTASAPGNSFLSRLNGWPARSPTDASPASSRMTAHGSGPMWFATPSSQWTCTTYSLPVSRRTCVRTLRNASAQCRRQALTHPRRVACTVVDRDARVLQQTVDAIRHRVYDRHAQ